MGKKMIFFGASNFGSLVYSYIENREDVVNFCDNSPEKWGKTFCGLEIISPEQILEYGNVRIIITSQYVSQITRQLFNMGFKVIEVAEIIPDRKHSKGCRVEFKKFDYTKINSLDIIKNRICLVNSNSSGSNTYALYKLAPKRYREKYDLKLLKEYEKGQDYYLNLITCNMTIGTSGTINHEQGKLSLELWHGFPLKGLGSMVRESVQHDDFTRQEWNYINKIASYSQIYNILMSACFGTHVNQHFISGMPRNDFLFIKDGRDILCKILKKNLKMKKIVFYMPTFRESAMKYEKDVIKIWKNLFGFQGFSDVEFNNFLKENNIAVIVKIHQYEEEFVIRHIEKFDLEDVYILSQYDLRKSGYDLYETLNAADLLITDYSSVYFDYLLLDRPILYTPVDLEHYRKTRGLLLEPYDFWTPGPKVSNQDDLQKEILKLLQDRNYYGKERRNIKKVVHRYTDGRSCERIFDIIDKMIAENDKKVERGI